MRLRVIAMGKMMNLQDYSQEAFQGQNSPQYTDQQRDDLPHPVYYIQELILKYSHTRISQMWLSQMYVHIRGHLGLQECLQLRVKYADVLLK